MERWKRVQWESEFPEFIMGYVDKDNPLTLEPILPTEPCPSCDYYALCGGKCLYTDWFKPWHEDGFDMICGTVKHLIDELRNVQPEIEELIAKNILTLEQFNYPPYNGCEIIP